MAISRTVFGLSDMFLAATPEPLLPSLAVLRQQGGPAVQMTWATDAGLHTRSRMPYPGADSLATLAGSGSTLNMLPQLMSSFTPLVAGMRTPQVTVPPAMEHGGPNENAHDAAGH